ncbi:MAG: hypothetical protein JNM17_39385 [Archangium sp.]|nr:hypothetical protein [Archangium sp.]
MGAPQDPNEARQKRAEDAGRRDGSIDPATLHEFGRLALALVIGAALLVMAWNIVAPKLNLPESLVARALIVVALGVSAFFLFELRRIRARAYATVEFFVGCVTAWLAFDAPNLTDQALRLAAAVYLMVRALDNWSRGAPTALNVLEDRVAKIEAQLRDAPSVGNESGAPTNPLNAPTK